MMAAHIPSVDAPDDEKPVLYVATIYGVRDADQIAAGGQLDGL